MTNNEAIEWLISMYNIANQINDCLEYKETLDIAIKALEQQPCEDCISREEFPIADKYVQKQVNEALDKIRTEIEEHRRKTASIDTYDLVGDCLNIINKYKTENKKS